MKKTVLFLIMVVALSAVSCNKEEILDQPLRGQETLDDFFSTAENAELFVNGIYRKVNGESWFQVNFQRQINEMATDDNWAGNTRQPRPDITGISQYNVFAGSRYFVLFWESHYIGITRANISLDRIPGVDIDEDKKARLLAEARFLRAFFYFDLVRNYGGVPLVTTYNEILEPSINDKKRSTVEEVYAFVEQDLLDAIGDLPLKSEYAAADLGRVTKGAARSLLAKVYLYQEKWSEAQAMAKVVIDSGEYSLESDFADLYRVGNAHGVESIFAIEFINNPTFTEVGGQFSITNGSRGDRGWGWGSPTSDLENAFLSEGDNIRLRSTIIKHGEPVFGDPDVTEFDGKPSENKSGRTNRKYYTPIADRPEPYARGQIPGQYIHIRLADVILFHAEAAYFNGDETSARNSLKLVRDRVSLNTNMSLSGAALRDAIWKERRLELALEQHRLYDIRRQKINGVPRIASILGPNGSFVKYNTEESTDPFETTNLLEPQNSGTLFDPDVHMLWPIPPDEIQLSRGNITQNPGY
ncbi:RagB/SusD family nutrient uptake outer membrane protein [Hyunsoonleella pacifica]|uniref:RagB/SusD family nutrient uptake outer membrane protein n=1 Tax=Hyunsoonleella pacifica TaxID=1080224 RepID=A0A4Q9FSJ8_9FLAO|nr:RagB/SusD family nutrient uptake outer membrane protein [Hyunsoonleella pacifica]TBN18660.1 RagB/SusD family nutrient uptake outer membrane protein [Hyunsoonleella pacifica]GGD03633.1 membrane protein [Hyunsoonleella pacifica]